MPAAPVPASTVILLRDSSVSPEVLLIERHAKSEFLPDMYVFPGGRVEEADRALSHRVQGLTDRGAALLVDTVDPEHAMSFVVAAIRETWEEAGILLATRRGSADLLGPEEAQALGKRRLDVQSGDHSFQTLIEAEDLMLAADRMAVHGHWITPEMVPRRFDTIFFSAVAPPGQLAAHDGVESTDHVWIRPEDALAQAKEKTRQIIFPTAATLETLRGFETAAEALEASRARPVVPVLPVITEVDGERRLAIPEEAGYPTSYEKMGG